MSSYEIVIGIETHVQLATKSKLFCGCNNDSREAEPNTNVCPVCLGFPGALPVLNAAAVDLTLRAGHALNAYESVKKFHSKFDRKNYFYPDSPMNYQITQFDEPIIGNGYVEFPLEGGTKRVGITRAHLEADAGKLIHPTGADYSLVDLNRAGTPLLEIVSEPDMRSAAEAKAYVQELYHLMRYAGVSDANLYYGNMRFDVNVSVRPVGSKEFGTRTESKNLNSFRAVAGVVDYEAKRQAELLEQGKAIVQETRGWDEAKQKTISQRSKEEAHDYRYFPEPDLPPLVITEKMLEEAKNEMPEILPSHVRDCLHPLGFNDSGIEKMLSEQELAEIAMTTADTATPDQSKQVLNWFIGYPDEQLSKFLQEWRSHHAANGKTTPYRNLVSKLIAIAQLVEKDKISSTGAKSLFSHVIEEPDGTEDPEKIAERLNLLQVSDSGALEKIVDEVIAAHPQPVADYQAGEKKALGFLVGQVMKASKGQANPPMVNAILKQKLED